jgi:Flp pilus assembly protein TadD
LIPLGNWLAELGDVSGAEDAYRTAYDVGEVFAAMNIGALLWDQGDHEEARSWIVRGAAQGDASAVAWLEANPEPKR